MHFAIIIYFDVTTEVLSSALKTMTNMSNTISYRFRSHVFKFFADLDVLKIFFWQRSKSAFIMKIIVKANIKKCSV